MHAIRFQNEALRSKFRLPESVSFFNISIEGNLTIGDFTYINDYTRIDTGLHAKIKIGKHCAIGRYVHITAKTHSMRRPTRDDLHGTHETVEGDINIGDCVWIGDHVVILPGVTIGDHAVVGAHTLVKSDVKPFEVVAGVPAKHIRINTDHYQYKGR
jgi:acetyltransferase-like isoleucine patch superfamily enzyme